MNSFCEKLIYFQERERKRERERERNVEREIESERGLVVGRC